MTTTELIGYMAKISVSKTLRNKYAFLVELLELILFLFGAGALYILQFLPIDILLYIIGTMLMINAMGVGIKVGANLIFYKDRGVLQEFFSSPATTADKIFGLIAEQTPALILKATIIMLLLAAIIKITMAQVIALYIIIMLTALIASFISIAISSKTNNLQLVGIVVYISGVLQFGLNGLILKAKELPIVILNPYSYVADLLLHASEATPNYPILLDIAVIIAIAAIIYKMAVVAIDRLEIYG